MKTKFKYFSLAIAALLMVGFASCSSDDVNEVEVPEAGATKSVTLKINAGVTTRAEVPAINNADIAALNTGHIYFTTAEGAIIKHYAIAATEVTGSAYTPAQLVAGVEIKGLTANIQKVYIFGNTPISLPETGPISLVKSKVIGVVSQATITNVNLYGDNNIAASGTTEVTIAPTVARIELAKITGTQFITGYKVSGIFVDNYYEEATVDGTLVGSPKDNGKVAVNYVNGSTFYPETLTPSIYDWYAGGLEATGTMGNMVAKPADGSNVWGYNLFAKNSFVPRIIIRLTAIKNHSDSGISFGDEDVRFVTIKGFKEVSELLPNYIYKISSADFCSKDLSTDPNLAAKDITVKVTVTPWTSKDVTPEI